MMRFQQYLCHDLSVGLVLMGYVPRWAIKVGKPAHDRVETARLDHDSGRHVSRLLDGLFPDRPAMVEMAPPRRPIYHSFQNHYTH